MRRQWTNAAIGALLACACSAGEAALPGDVGAEVAMGKNLTGDECRLRRIEPGTWGQSAQVFRVHCEGWTAASGGLTVLRGDQRAPAWWMRESNWMLGVRDLGECDEPLMEGRIEGFAAMTLRCRHRMGWRLHMLAAYGYGSIYLADFLPNNTPLLERAVMVAAGRAALEEPARDGVRMAALRALEEMIGKESRLPSVRQIGDYVRLHELARGFSFAGQSRKAEQAFNQLLRVQEGLFGLESPAIASTLQWLANSVSRQGRESEAVALTAKAEPYVQKSSDRELIAQQHNNMGFHALRRRDLSTAEASFERAVAVSGGSRPRHSFMAIGYGGIAAIRERKRDWAGVTKFGLDGYRHHVLHQGEHGIWTESARILLARGYIEQKNFEEARKWVDHALRSSELMYGRTFWWANAKLQEGNLLRLAGKASEALNAYRAYAAFAAREEVACHYAPCLSSYLDLLREQVAGGSDQAALGEAFRVAQLAQGSVVNAAISQLAARVGGADPAVAAFTREHQQLLERQARARALLRQETRKPAKQRKEEVERKLAEDIRQAAETVEQRELVLQDRHPRYAQLVSRSPAGLARVAETLAPGEALLYLAHVGDKGYTFLLHEGRLSMRQVALSDAELVARVAALRRGLTPQRGLLRDFDAKLSHDLYRDLVGPLLDQQERVQRLIVVPSGPLLSLPPDVLVMRPPDAASEPAWLVQRFALAVVPSVRSLVELRSVSGTAAPISNFLGVGHPRYAAHVPASALGKDQSDPCAAGHDVRALVGALTPLPEAAEEVRAMAAVLGAPAASLMLEESATKAALLAQPLETKGVLAFATHGMLPGELKCEREPSLALATGPGTDISDDGLLRASEVATLKLNASLVILSACNTASADGQLGGESLSGLVRAFFFAGARNVLATHWRIASEPTVTLTTGMVRDAAGGKSWPEALREGKLRMMKAPSTAHPYYWGAFSLIGGG